MDDTFEKSSKQDWRYKSIKCGRCTFAEKQKYNNATTWQIDSLKRLLTEIEKDSKRVLSKILDMRSIYIKYLKKTNRANKKRDKICTYTLKLKQELYISNEERE